LGLGGKFFDALVNKKDSDPKIKVPKNKKGRGILKHSPAFYSIKRN